MEKQSRWSEQRSVQQHSERREQIVQQQEHVQRTQHFTQMLTQQVGTVGGERVPITAGRPGEPSPPIFEQIFKNARFAQGGNAKFEGKLRGNPTPVVSWTRKKAPLVECNKYSMIYNEQTGDVSLLIKQIGPGDEGEYTCTARNQYGEAICSVYIQPEGVPVPTQQASQQQSYRHVSESVEHKSYGTHEYMTGQSQQSQKFAYTNGTDHSASEDFKVDTFEYRLLREVSFRETITKRYISESDIQVSTEIDKSLGPVAPPKITQKPRNSKLQEGTDAQFQVQLSGNPRPRTTWFKNGQRLVNSAKHNIINTNNQTILRIRNVQKSDSGHYTLLAENPNGCVVSSAYLAVESPHETYVQDQKSQYVTDQQIETERIETSEKALAPQFVKVCQDRDVTEGKMTRFDCRVTGRPYPEVTWFINDRQIRDDYNHKILVNESGNHALMITNVDRSDSGVVTCVARNKSGEISFQCRLNVIEREQVVAPKFIERFTTLSVREGEPVILNARAIGTPTPRITWQKDGGPIIPNPELRINTDGGASTLDIPRAKASDAAWYQCTAQNVAGSTATRARLYVEVPKEPPPEQKRLHLPRPTKIIEPEPAPGPEIIYLRHVERARPYVPPGEEDRIYPPPQFIVPLRSVTQTEGGKIHFETRIEPVGDPTMKIEWLKNGQSIEASSRFTSIFRFGYISLDMLSLNIQDSGEYTCRAVSSTGIAETKAMLQVTPRATIERTSQHPESLQYIQHLEDYSKYQHQESIEEQISQRPQFIRPLQDLGELQEGRNAHFEAQLTPVSDPTMRVEWYKDGKSITASSRITAIFNFGYVSLNIMHLRVEDAGSYTVRAVNKLGEAISTATIRVAARSTVTEDLGIPEQRRYIEKTEQLEAYQQQQHQRYYQEVPESTQRPEFKTPIKDQMNIKEGGFAHFEARLEPVGDSTLRVEWLKDGRAVEASSRITTFFNFGYVALTIKSVTIHDAGNYTCRAYNALGQATTSANLTVVTKKDIIAESQHPGGLEKIQYLEDSSRYLKRSEEEVKVTQKPRFLGPLKGTNKIVEGQSAHFEARVEPQSDLTMIVEWYFNGKQIKSANRIQTYHDFGYVALDITNVRAEDAGVYTVVARNASGEAQLSASMVVETRSSIDTSSIHHGLYEKTRQMEESKFVEPMYHIEEISKSKPVFVQPLSDPKSISEGKNIHLECRLEPMGDPTMRVEWYHNGRAVTVGSRFRTYYDFGFVALDIIHATSSDSGEYTVRAVNHLGSAHTSAMVRVIERSDIVTDTQHEQAVEQIQMLEDAARRTRQVQEDITVMQAPQFSRALHNIETIEGTNVHLECRLQPVGDPTMRVEWFCNGRPIKTGHRFRPAYEFDYVALDLLSVYPEDSGVYTCQATNQLGEAVTSCALRVMAKKDLIFESQHPSGLEKIQYLEDASRYKKSEVIDESIHVKPRFVTKPKSVENVKERQHVHFECKLEPVTDSNLKVEWFKNGQPVTIGHRFRPIHDFGYVALDIIDCIAEDSGIYTCRAVNLLGTDEVSCKLTCRETADIIRATQNEAGLEQIHVLEDRSRYQRSDFVDEVTTQAPLFTTSLKNIEIKEGQRAHFECRLIPVSDATMKVEWYHNSKPLKSGSRFTETNNFGFVALDIMSCLPEDSGVYTCRAINALGEAVTSATAVVHSKKSIYLESQHQEALPRLHQLEDTSRHHKPSAPEDAVSQAPVFTLPMRDIRVAENQAAHFEARLIPVGDPRLKVEWLRNGVPITASNRITTMHDFGYVALNMKYVNPEDSGTYTCRAVNELGQAVTSSTLFVQSKASLLLESQNQAALQKIRQLEDTSRYQRKEEIEVAVNQAPRFVTQLNGPSKLVEGQSAHYECRIEPYPDPTMRVEWYFNGKVLQSGHRYRTAFDFGFAALDILTVYGEDSGEYTCKVINNLGQATSSINLNVQSKESIIRDTQHESALEKIQYLEDDSRYKKVVHDESFIAEKPQFGKPIKNAEAPEGQPIHLEATLTPVNDPTMRVEWYCNGRPIQQGHRFKTTYDFGYVALDVLYAYAEDSGTYMCKARNAVGEAVTTSSVKVDAKAGLYLDTLDEQRLRKIQELEKYERPKPIEEERPGQRPVFLTPLTNLENLKEGDHAHFESRVEPINDSDLKIEWFLNGQKIKTGHRFRTTHDFGYVALDILYTYAEDSGTYMCKATNKLGEAVNTCTLKVAGHRNIILDTQHPNGLEKIRQLEAQGHTSRMEVEEPKAYPPRFVTELRGTTHVFEGQTAHFECQVEPVHDPNLRIEFYHNGKALQSASRFHITFDFGYVSLDIQHCVPEDAGEYSVKAINALGQCTSTISMTVTAKGSIISESQRPEGLEKIRELESAEPFKRPEIPEPVTRQRPVFTQPLQNIDNIQEGQTAHLDCRLIPVGDPTLKVEWFRNEKLIADSSRITKTHDFGFVSMTINHVRDEDEGVYMCRASNLLGEAVTTAAMKIKTKAAIQLETQHPEGMKKIQKLEQPQPKKGEEPDREFEKPIFTQVLTGPSELWEGQHAHYEARVVPVGDPSLRFEWYINGVELKMGSRFRTTHDFGFVTLDINSVVSNDAGLYMCKAINKAGSTVSSTSLKVKTKSTIIDQAMRPESWEKIQLKEASMNQVPERFVDLGVQQAPIFTTHLQSYDKLVEGQHLHLEAQVEPRTDPHLRIEWFKNGVSLTTGSRIKSTFDFGLVTLSINSLRHDDSGIYTCKAVNQMGEAVSTASIKIEDRHWLMGDTLHPESLDRIGALEQPKQTKPDSPEPVYETPVFITHLNNILCKEGDNIHFECNVEPSRDPTLKIEWFFNNKPLPSGTRYKSTHDFSYVSLDIMHTYEEDSGIYTCKATNNKGSATTSGTLRCTGDKQIYLDTQHPQGKAGLEAVEQAEEARLAKSRRSSVPDTEYPKPEWIVPIVAECQLVEGQPLHLEGQVEPKDDPALKIEWYFNGKVLEHGSRFKLASDFGFVTLDVTDVYERDSGIYTCKAYNKRGEAFTSSTIYCSSKDNLIERTQHPKGKEGLEKIQNLEDSLRKEPSQKPDDDTGRPPEFTTVFQDIFDISEGQIAHYEASLIPTGDQTMVIEWFYNGKTIEASHRIRTVYAFGMVVLEILGTKTTDSGIYSCRATNKWGQAEISVKLECVDKSKGQKPKFTTHIQNIEGLKDGQSAHFECTVVPVDDPDMKIEWYHNGQPLRHSNRIKTISDFGFVVMDIAYTQNHDTGEYVCRAYNKYGEDFTKATINCYGRSGVFSDSLQPDSLAKIRELESLQGLQHQAPAPASAVPPKFTTQIEDVTKLVEGQSAHFEARLIPVDDPDLKVEWYYNGKKLPHGHRYRTFHDFGIVILDILYCYEENSGEYECVATNKLGRDSTKATLKCTSKENLILDSQLPRGMEGGLEKLQTLEDSMIRRKDVDVTETKGKAPVFTVPLSNIDNLREGENAHFEARLTPTDDPKLKIEWYWNGKSLKAGSRFRTFCDFGFVILEISPTYPEDSGEYMCRAYNNYGEAVTTATMKVQGKRNIILESQLPKGMEGTIDKIAALEGYTGTADNLSPEVESGNPPEFVTTPSDVILTENSSAHFECRLIPVNDSSMRVEWFHNGKPLLTGSRVKTINDFGFVILEIGGVYQRDAGLYTCKATNRHGEATVSCKLQVKGRQGIILEPQLPSHFKSGTESIQKLEETLHKREEIPIEDEQPNPPKFIVEIKDNLDVAEGGPIHFDCRVEPVGDPTMRIDWFHNGRPFATGSRVHMLNDFGFIALDIDYIYARDSGEYTCRATNKWGSATTTAKITCSTKRDIIFESQLPQGMSGEKIKELEKGRISDGPKEEPVINSPPKFVTQIKSHTIEESESIRFECRVEPKEDPRLRIEWYRNGKLLPSGHRFRTVYDMGFVSLDILYVYSEDSGEYVCRAVNDFGEDFTKATVSCKRLPDIILQNQVPRGMKKTEALTQMEATIKKYTSEVFLTEEDLYDVDKKQPPRFVTQIQSQTNLVEMEMTKFECQLAPVGDPNMKVEWFFNGKPLLHKNRFTPIYDFGYVAMNFGWVYPEDSGEYLCRATNLYGMDETKAVIKTAGKPGIVYDSQLPKHMKSIEKIREMEASWQAVPEKPGDEVKERTAPVFVSKPEPVTVEEGEWARFCCRVTGHPKPRVMWLINGNTIVNGSRYKLTYDGMYHFDIPKTRQYDTGKIEVIARSSVGEALATTELKIIPRHDDYRSVLKNAPRPWYDETTQYQRSDTELEKTFEERQTLQRKGVIDHRPELKQKIVKEPDTEWQQTVKKKKSEEYYNKLQELENEQIVKESRMRESTHQYAVSGDKVASASVARSMAQKYEDNLEQTEEIVEKEVTKKVQKPRIPDPLESTVHGKEVHVAKQKQIQKEVVGDTEITRKITSTETTEVEHKAQTQERIVEGPVKPSNPPVFTKKMQPCRVFEHEQARFEVEFDGDPLPTIKWYRENFPIKNSADFQIHTFSTKSILIIRQVFIEDSAVFAAVAENRGGTAKCSANLVVEERRRQGRGGVIPPSFTLTAQNVNVTAGQLVRFDAKVTGTKPIDVYWLKNGKKVQPDIRNKILEEDGTYTLLILEAFPQDSGKYECVAINSSGEARCDAECVVNTPATKEKPKPQTKAANAPPEIIEPMKDRVVTEGQAIEFSCKIVGKPIPTVQWYKEDRLIKPSKYFQMSRTADDYTLRISEAFPEDEGDYKCVAYNSAGRVTVAAKLKVTQPDQTDNLPTLTPLRDVIVYEGQPAQFKTQITSKVKPTIQWLREGALIPETPDFQMIHEGNNAVLLIGSTYEEDTGIFTCRATTVAGQVESSAKLVVKKSSKSKTTTAYENGVETQKETIQDTETSLNRVLHFTSEDTNILKMTNVQDIHSKKRASVPWRTKENSLEVKHWRKLRPDTQATSSLEDSNILHIDRDVSTSENKHWHKQKIERKHDKDIYSKEEAIPWIKEAIQLKPTKVDKIPNRKEKMEEVTLKPLNKTFNQVETLLIDESLTSEEETVVLKIENKISVSDIQKDEQDLQKEDLKPDSTQKALKIVKEADKLQEVSWRAGKRKPKEEQPVEEVVLKPVPRQKQPDEDKPEEVQLKPVKKEKPIVEDKPEEVSWRTGKRKPKEEQPVEEVVLKPVPRQKQPDVDRPEEVQLKPVMKEKPIVEDKPEEVSWRTGKRKPKQEQPVEEMVLKPVPRQKQPDEEKPEEVQLKPVKKEKPIEEDKPEEVSWRTGKRKPKEEQPVEEVVLKPVPRQKQPDEEKPEEVQLKPVKKEKPIEEDKPEEVSWRTGKRKPKQEQPVEEVVLKPVPRQKQPDEEKPEEVQLKPVKKEKPIEEDKPEEVSWRTGKRKPKEEQPVEEVVLKPVPRQKQPDEEKPEEVQLKPVKKEKPIEEDKPEEVSWRTGKRKPKEEQPVEEVVLKPVPRQKQPDEEKPEEVQLKPVKKEKPIEEDKPEEVSWRTGKRKPKEEQPVEEVVLKPVPRQKQPDEDKPEEVQLKPVKKEKPIEEDKPEEVSWRTGKRKPKEEQPVEEVVLKPVPRQKQPDEDKPEEVQLKPVKKEKPIEEDKPEEVSLKTGKRKPKQEQPEEEVVLKPVPKQRPTEKEEKPEEVQLKPVKKEKPIEEDEPEEVSLKSGKRKPKQEQPEEEVAIKPVPKQRPTQKEEKPEEAQLKPVKKEKLIEEDKPEEVSRKTGKRKPKEEQPVEEVVLKPVPKQKPTVKEEKPEEVQLKPAKKEKLIEEDKPEEVSLKTGKRKPKEEQPVEEVVLKPIPKQKPNEKEEKPEEIQLKPVKKEKPVVKDEPEEVSWRAGKRKPKEEQPVEEVVLKPVPRQKQPDEDKPEEVQLKPVKKEKPIVEDKPGEVSWRTGKRKPKEEQPVEEVVLKPVPRQKQPDVDRPEEVQLKPVMKEKPIVEDKPEEVSWRTGKRKPKQEQPVEEVVLKPVPRQKQPDEEKPEEVQLKPVKKEKPIEEDKPEEVSWRTGKRKPKEEQPVEEVVLKPVPRQKQPDEEKPEEVQLKPVKKEKPIEEDKPEEVSWRTGKRKPKEEQPVEEVVLKPVPRQKQPDEEKPEEIQLKPVKKEKAIEEDKPVEVSLKAGKIKPKEEQPVEEVVLKPIPKQKPTEKENKPEEVHLKPVKKEKPIEEPPEEVSLRTGKRKPKEGQPVEEVVLKPVTIEKQPVEDKPDEVQVKPVKKEKLIDEEDKPETSDFKPIKKEKPTEEEKSVETMTFKTISKEGILEETGPIIIQPIKAAIVKENDTFEFIVMFKPNIVKKISWSFNNKIIKNDEEFKIFTEPGKSILIVQTASKTKVGKYEVLIENKDMVVKSASTLKLKKISDTENIIPPVFTRPLQPKHVALGEIILLETEVISNPCASFQWFLGNKEVISYVKESKIKNMYVTSNENISCLCIEDSTRDVPDIITCRAENFAGSVSCSAQVNVVDENDNASGVGPKFLTSLSPTTVMDGEPILLKCSVIGQPWPKIDWYHNGKLLEVARDVTIGRQESGLCQLFIKEAFPEMTGNYECVATNKFGQCISNCIVNVEAYEYVPSASEEDILSDEKTSDLEEFAPKIVKALPAVVKTNEGELTRLEAKAIGIPKPQIRWLKQGVEIKESQEYQIEEMEDGTSILIIPEVYQDDMGEITFEAYNPLGVSSTVAALSVESLVGTKEYRKPEWVSHMEELQEALKATQAVPSFVRNLISERVLEGETVTFEAVYSGNPKPEIIWYKDNKVIKSNNYFQIETKDNITVCKIKKASKKLQGCYECKAISDIGMAITKADLQIFEAEETFEKVEMKRVKSLKQEVVDEKTALMSSEDASIAIVETTLDVLGKAQPLIKTSEKQKTNVLVNEMTSIETVDVASFKKTDQKYRTTSTEELVNIEPFITPNQYLVSSQQETNEMVQTFEKITHELQKGIARRVSDSRMVAEVNELLEVINAKEFGPGESPLRELATIGYLLRNGVTVEEIENLYDSEHFPSLRIPQSQSALVQLVERQGHGALITEVLTEETAQTEDIIGAKVGFKAFMKLVEMKHTSVEEVIAHLYPEDFTPRAWEEKGAREIVVESIVKDVAQVHSTTIHKDKTTTLEQNEKDIT
ncbi:titin isoform X5 [Pieris brassicae]|uniref:titin isoform X5 n=1 Tax=Pieris brassicae TaxID=7116 RepID=UPI001E66250B|nr:titin isoform X5 [Pieris brassicae]